MNLTNHKAEQPQEDPKLAELRESIRRSFPAEIYTGKVTENDRSNDPEMDDEKELFNTLSGRSWTDVPKSLLRAQPDGYELLTDAAFVAFLPAWLTESLDDIDAENEVRNFVVYAFSPRPHLAPNVTSFKMHRLRCLSSGQRQTLRSLLTEFVKWGASPFLKRLASEAIELLDTVATG